MTLQLFLGIIGTIVAVIGLYLKVFPPDPKDSQIKVIVGIFVGVLFGVLIGGFGVGADVILNALFSENSRPQILFSGNLAITLAFSTVIGGALGGMAGALVGIEQNTERATTWGSVIGAIAGLVFVRIALFVSSGL